ncbi:MAG: hypothetical protein ACI4AA_08725 [Lachnospiraceae bacterium]
MFGFIFTVIIICIIIQTLKKQNNQGNRSQNSQGAYGSAPSNGQGYRPNSGNYQGQQSGGAMRQTAGGRNVASQATRTSQTAKSSQTVKAPQTANTSQKETSTMDYLNEKAKQDQREHAIEKMQENKRVDRKYGNRPVGGRYLLGDPVPSGMRIVYCPYCGAENLVKIGFRDDRDCYFCRSRLES